MDQGNFGINHNQCVVGQVDNHIRLPSFTFFCGDAFLDKIIFIFHQTCVLKVPFQNNLTPLALDLGIPLESSGQVSGILSNLKALVR